MKKLFLFTVIFSAFSCGAIAQLKIPAPSPTQTIRQEFGLSSIELSYSRPGAKNRKMIGGLLPYDSVWRTGANQATTLNFGDAVTIGGTAIPAGKYGLLSIPGKSSWTMIITKQVNVTSSAAYNKDSDIVRVPVKPVLMKDKVETLTMQFANVKPSSCELHIMWENTAIVLPVKTEIDDRIMARINDAMAKDNPPYSAAASYYLDNGKDLNKAKEWAEKAVKATPESYPALYLLARIQAGTGDKKAAVATALKSIEWAKKGRNYDYVRLNETLMAGLK